MKIAILSMQRILNYGSVLQAFSMREMLEDITGETVEFIDIETERTISVNMPIRDNVDYCTSNYKRTLQERFRGKVFNTLRKKNEAKLEKFMSNELRVDYSNNQKHYDLVFVGSDEVFKSLDKINLQLYGEINQADYVATYAASCGAASLEGIGNDVIDTVRKAMSNFIAMSVRDAGTEAYVKGLYTGEIERHLDPVLMGTLNEKQHKKVFLKKYMIIYAYGGRIHSKEEIDAIRSFAKKHGLKTLAIGGMQYWCDMYIPLSPFRVLDYFYYADYIITDTFHGTIFSVINHKKFATIIRKTNQNKLTDLLETLGLNDRIVTNMFALDKVIEADINYSIIEKKLDCERKKTKEYLQRVIYDVKEKVYK